jgi:hypothetical protein
MYFERLEDGRLVLVTDPVGGKTYFDKDGKEVVYQAPSAAVHAKDDVIGEPKGMSRPSRRSWRHRSEAASPFRTRSR